MVHDRLTVIDHRRAEAVAEFDTRQPRRRPARLQKPPGEARSRPVPGRLPQGAASAARPTGAGGRGRAPRRARRSGGRRPPRSRNALAAPAEALEKSVEGVARRQTRPPPAPRKLIRPDPRKAVETRERRLRRTHRSGASGGPSSALPPRRTARPRLPPRGRTRRRVRRRAQPMTPHSAPSGESP